MEYYTLNYNDLIRYTKEFLYRLDAKAASLNAPINIKINDYNFGCNVSITYLNKPHVYITIDNDCKYIHVSTFLLMDEKCETDLDLAIHTHCPHLSSYVSDNESLQLSRMINYSEQLDESAIVCNIKFLVKSTEHLLNMCPEGFSRGILDEENFERFSSLVVWREHL